MHAIFSRAVRGLVFPLVGVLACGFHPLPVEEAANSSRTDAKAADGAGGWLDLGSNDLGVLPAGRADFAGVTFVVPPSGDETARNCIVLGRAGAESRTLALKQPVTGSRLYLLHASAGGPDPETHRRIGRVCLRYADGTRAERDIRVGADVSDWTDGRSFPNAARGWTEYNRNTQVSLFASGFALAPSNALAEVRFEADGTCPWMIVAATVGPSTGLKPVRGSVEPTGTYRSPEPPPAGLGRFPGRRPRNVILIVGDGMGQGAARLASYYKHGREDALYFQQLPVAGLCTTFSASDSVTDSAASATAFATGVKTTNGVLGMQVDENHTRDNAKPLVSVAARAHAQGLGVAVITSDPIYGGTPAAFYAHTTSRGDEELICAQAAECGYDILVGVRYGLSRFRPAGQGGRRKDGRDLVAEMQAKGYALVRTAEEMSAAPADRKILGGLKFEDEESIAEALRAAFGRLAANTNGFFMMAECTETDHAGHGNNASDAVKAVSMVEFMARAAVEFARARQDTLVVVMADHDTGHPMVLRGPGEKGRLHVHWSTTRHSQFPVPLYSYGPGAEMFEGLLDNTDIAKNVAHLLSLSE